MEKLNFLFYSKFSECFFLCEKLSQLCSHLYSHFEIIFRGNENEFLIYSSPSSCYTNNDYYTFCHIYLCSVRPIFFFYYPELVLHVVANCLEIYRFSGFFRGFPGFWLFFIQDYKSETFLFVNDNHAMEF